MNRLHQIAANSLQTVVPLTALRTNTTARSLEWFEKLATGGETELDTDQPYQRGDVWNDCRRRLLIRSIIQGIPIGTIIINDRHRAHFREYSSDGWCASRDWAYAVIDGKQRLTTIVKWLRSELAVPASWFRRDQVEITTPTTDGPYVCLGSLVIRERRHFGNLSIPVVETAVGTLGEEQAIFDLINFGGVVQGDTDL